MGKVTWQPVQFQPVDPGSVEAGNLLYRRGGTLRAQIGGRNLSCEPLWLRQAPDIAEPWTLAITLDRSAAELVLPQSVVHLMLHDLAPTMEIEALSPEHRALFVEYALGDMLEGIENALGCAVSIDSAYRSSGQPGGTGQQTLCFRIAADGVPGFTGMLRADPASLLRLGRALDRQRGPAAMAATPIDLPMPVHLRWASVDLPLSELKTLMPGDIVLADACAEADTVIAVIGEDLGARARIVADGVQLLDALRPLNGSSLGWCAPGSPSQPGRFRNRPSLDFPVRVFFELAQFDVPLAQLRELRPGSRLAAPDRRGAAFDIVVEGSRIGTGEKTSIGAGAGMRILRV